MNLIESQLWKVLFQLGLKPDQKLEKDPSLGERRFRDVMVPLWHCLPEGLGESWDGVRVVDIGAGHGGIAKVLQRDFGASVKLYDRFVRERSYLPVHQFNGRKIPENPDSFDVALLLYVLHHDPENMISLLREAGRVASRAVIVTEDIMESEVDKEYCQRHDPQGLFLSRTGWKELFRSLGFALLEEGIIGKCAGGAGHRAFFILRPPENVASGRKTFQYQYASLRRQIVEKIREIKHRYYIE